MKKIMVMLGVVALAACAQAASVLWNSGTVVNSAGTTANATTALVNAYVWEITEAQYNTYNALSGTALSDAINKDFASALASADISGATNARGAVNLKGATAHGAGDVVYGAILYVDAVNTGYYMGNVAVAEFAAEQNVTMANLANIQGGGASGTATAWSSAPVPEPTSGLLLLMGLAGLALRRKHA